MRWYLRCCLGLICIATANFGVAQETKNYDEILASYKTTPRSITTSKSEPRTGEEDTIPKYGVVRYDIFRDRNPFPIDPRKPCPVCTKRENHHGKQFKTLDRIYGFQGRPYREVEPGACLCGKKKQKFKHLNTNVYWPSLFAGLPEAFAPKRAANRAVNLNRFRPLDFYDRLGGFEVSSYQRRDNGYCGPGRDPYGCLGESRTLFSNVTGVGIREPGQPVDRGVVFP